MRLLGNIAATLLASTSNRARRTANAALAALLLAASAGAAAQSVSFTAGDFFIDMAVGVPTDVEIETRDDSFLLVGGGGLQWQLLGCSGVTFTTTPPATADASGTTTSNIVGTIDEVCEMTVAWDHDNDEMTPAIVPSSNLTIFVTDTPVSSTILAPDAVVPRFVNPEFGVRLTSSVGVPLPDASVTWRIEVDGSKPFFFGGDCSPSYTTNAQGEAFFDFESAPLSNFLGTYVVTAEIIPSGCGMVRRGGAQTQGLVIDEVFNFAIEDVLLRIVGPETFLFKDAPAEFEAFLETTPSQVAIPGFALDWEVNFLAATPSTGTTLPTDSNGRALVQFTPTEPGFKGELFVSENAQLKVSDSLFFDVAELLLQLVSQPAPPTFTDEVAPPFTIQSLASFGTGNGKGFGTPIGGIPLAFDITSGNGSFTANNSTQFLAVTDIQFGTANSSSVQVGRTDQDVTVVVSAAGAQDLIYNIATTPSSYSLQATSPTNPTIDDTQTVDLTVQALRASISVPQALGAGEVVTWSITSAANGAVVTSSTVTDAMGLATATFDPAVGGLYEVVASFDPGIVGVSPGTATFNVEVLGTGPAVSLVPFEGDFTSAPPGSQVSLSARYLEDGLPAAPNPAEPVLWSVVFGDATVSPESSLTGAPTGIATTTLTLGNSPGTALVQAQLQNFPDAIAYFYVETLPIVDLEVVEPASRLLELQAGEPFDILVALRDQQGVGIGQAPLEVSSDLPGASPETLFTDVDGSALFSGVAPPGNGTYRVEFRYDGFSGQLSGAGSKATGPPPISEFVTILVTDGVAQIIPVEGDGQRGLVNQAALPLRALYTIDDLPTAGIPVQWSVTGGGSPTSTSTLTNGDGIATLNYTFGGTPGPVVVTATVGEVSTQFLLEATVGQLGIASGDGQSGAPGEPLANPLVVVVSVPPANAKSLANIPVSWAVVAGSGSLAQAVTLTDANGQASNSFVLGDATGLQQVRASIAGGAEVVFSANALTPSLSIVSGNGQRGPVQTVADLPLIVELLDAGGRPLAGQDIQWSISGGDAVLIAGGAPVGNVTQVPTDEGGRSRIDFRYGSAPGPITIQAVSALTGGPAIFTAQAELPGLRIVSGDNQSGDVGATLAEDFVVSIAPEAVKALGGVTINWQVLSGNGTLANSTSVTDASGVARNRLTLGAEPGANQVRASILNGPQVTLNATALNPAGQLVKVSGDNQANLPTNTDSAPMVVRLNRVGGGVFAGATIRWEGSNAGFVTTEGGALASQTTSTTNAQGEARIIARVIASGPATVRAVVDNGAAAEPVVFTLEGAIANTGTLDGGQRDVAQVLDGACAALANLASRTPAQEDLLQRCRELQRNAGDNPGDVGDALDELSPDVGLTMTGAGLEVISTQVANVNGYLIEARNNPGGGRFKLGLATADGMLPLSLLPAAMLDETSAEGQDLGPDFGRWGFFASGQIGRGKYTRGQRTPDFDYSSGNLTLGVDYRVTDTLILGGGVGFSRHDTDLRNDGGTLDVSGWNVIGYGTWYNERQWFVDGVVSLGSNDYDLRRNIDYRIAAANGGLTVVEQVASANTDGDQLGLSLSIGRDWQHGPWNINSYLRGNYLRTEYDAYSESMIAGRPGEGLALAVEARDLKSLSSILGGKATYILSRDWGILMPHVQAEWEHKFEDDPTQLFSRFLADPSGTRFIQLGDDIDTNTFNVGFGLSALWPGGRSAYLAYERLVGASGLTQNTLSVGVRVEF